MPTVGELLKQGRNKEVWDLCCGYLSLDLEQFMTVQKRLLLQQLQLLNKSVLGKKLMQSARPQTVEEFRQAAPLTTYADYCPELLNKNEDILPAKPAQWIRTSGRSGEYPCKWVPITQEFADAMSVPGWGLFILAGARDWHDTSSLRNNAKCVYTLAPKPYATGAYLSMIEGQAHLDWMPPAAEAEAMSFEDRIGAGFKLALNKGLDYFFGLSIVLVTVGNRFSESSQKRDPKALLSQPGALWRISKGVVKSKLAHRKMLPRDLWSVKGIVSAGLDSGVYREKIKEFWGRYPLDLYAGSEFGLMASQTWDYSTMTFIPNLNFFEFIPEDEHMKWKNDHSYKPRALLLDEVKAGVNYEIVITNFHGGAMTRYRVGDMIRIESLGNSSLGIKTPQMTFVGRCDGLLDFGVTRLTEKVIWQAIQNTGLRYEEWCARKEVGNGMKLRVYLELKDAVSATEAEIATELDRQIKQLDSSFVATKGDVGNYLDFKTEVTLLPSGSFARFIAQRRAEGAEFAHMKPPHINPSDKVLEQLKVPVRASTEKVIS